MLVVTHYYLQLCWVTRLEQVGGQAGHEYQPDYPLGLLFSAVPAIYSDRNR